MIRHRTREVDRQNRRTGMFEYVFIQEDPKSIGHHFPDKIMRPVLTHELGEARKVAVREWLPVGVVEHR